LGYFFGAEQVLVLPVNQHLLDEGFLVELQNSENEVALPYCEFCILVE
jgi:hypothetical protein